MKKVKDTPFSAIRWSVVTLVFLSLTVMVSAASALEPKKASDIVTLESNVFPDPTCEEGSFSFVELFPDGTTDSSRFSVPRGKVLVVTSIHLIVASGPVSESVGFKLFRESLSGFNTPFLGLVVTDGDGDGTRDMTLSPGFVVEHGINLCAQNPFVILYGFLAKDRDKHRGDD